MMTAAQPIFANVVTMKKNRTSRHRTTRSHFTADELRRILQAAREVGPREHAMFLFALAHGARCQEISNLRISDLDFDSNRVRIARVKHSNTSLQSFLAASDELFDEKRAFKSWLAVRKADNPEAFAFNSRKSAQLNRASIYRIFVDICALAKLEPGRPRNPHALKHSLAMLLMGSGANSFVMQQALGHKAISSTLAYSKPNDEQASVAIAEAFSKAF
jgi:integrase